MSNIPVNTIKAASGHYMPSKNENSIELSEIIGLILNNKWLIVFFILISMSLGVFKIITDDPIYESEVVLQIESHTPSLGGLGLQEPRRDDIPKPILTEIEIIKSRMTLSEVVSNLKTEINAEPAYFPVIGKAIARRYQNLHKDGKVSEPLFGQSQYAWGNEDIRVDTFVVPKDFLGKSFVLTAGQNGRYTLKLLKGDVFVLEGQVGKIARNDEKDPNKEVTLFVSLLKSRPDTQFALVRHSKDKMIDLMRKEVAASERGRNTGIVQLKMESNSPGLAERTLNEIANVYVRQNVEEKSIEARKTLEFLERQLPIIKDRLDSATAALNNFRVEKGSIDLQLETQNILKSIIDIKTQMTLLSQKHEELRQRYTEEHPAVVSISKQLSYLAAQKSESEKRIGVLPLTQQTIVRLSEEAEVNTTLYNTLLNKAQTLRVAKAGVVGDIRILDYAVLPVEPVKPKKALILLISTVLGVILGVGAVFMRKALHHGVENPDLIEQHLNIPIYATLAHSDKQQKITRSLKRKGADNKSAFILALEHKEDLAIESLRSLRTTLHFAFLEAQNNIMMITGPSPAVGKSFVSINLATVLADSGKKILLIDGDLRKGLINKALGVDRECGLSELISSTITVDQAIHKIPVANFDFIATGVYPPNPSELLLHERFGHFLENISKHYDHVIIDSPPILAVTDAAIVGRMASVTLMVIKSGYHPIRELEQATKRLIQAGVNLKGIVFNDVPQFSSRYGYGKYIYQYSYSKS